MVIEDLQKNMKNIKKNKLNKDLKFSLNQTMNILDSRNIKKW